MNAVISMAHNLKMRVVAEAVETEEQLRAQDCDEMQDYLLRTPLPSDEVEAFLTGKKIKFCSLAAS